MLNIQTLCGLSQNSSYVVWVQNDGTFGRCFLWTASSYAPHVVFAMLSAYYYGISTISSSSRPNLRRSSCLVLGITIVSFSSAVRNIIELVLSYVLHARVQHPPAYVLSKTISFTSWLMCFLLQRRTRAITMETKRICRNIAVVFMLVLVSSSLQLLSLIHI